MAVVTVFSWCFKPISHAESNPLYHLGGGYRCFNDVVLWSTVRLGQIQYRKEGVIGTVLIQYSGERGIKSVVLLNSQQMQ